MELVPKFCLIIHKTNPTYYNTATPRLQWNQSQNLVKLYDKAYILQLSYSKDPVELETKFGQIVHKTKPTYYNTANPTLQWSYSQNLVKLYTRQSLHTITQLLQGSSRARAKIWSNYKQDKAYILQHSYSKAPVELEAKFSQIIHKTKPTYYNTATQRLQQSYSQNLVKLYTRQSLHTTTQLDQVSSRGRAKVWSNYTQDNAYKLQKSYSKAPMELEPKFCRTIHNTEPSYYNTANPTLQWSYSQNLVKLYTRQSLHTITQLL